MRSVWCGCERRDFVGDGDVGDVADADFHNTITNKRESAMKVNNLIVKNMKRKLKQKTVGELLDLLETPMRHGISDAKLRRVRRLLLPILNSAGWFFDDRDNDEEAVTQGDDVAFFALVVAEYAVEGVDDHQAIAILATLGSLARNIAKQARLTAFTRGQFEALSKNCASYYKKAESRRLRPSRRSPKLGEGDTASPQTPNIH